MLPRREPAFAGTARSAPARPSEMEGVVFARHRSLRPVRHRENRESLALQEESESEWRFPTPNKKRKVQPGPTRAAKDLAEIGLPTPEASSLAKAEKPDKNVFLFLKLPAELRMEIYRWSLWSDEPLLLDLGRKADKDDDETKSTLVPVPRKNTGVNVALLRTCALVYKEARQIFYSENDFNLSIDSSVATLAQLHQRSRSLIRSVTLAIPSHHDILDSFADMVRLGLRYCWGLKTFTIRLEVSLPDFDTSPENRHGGIYANAFRILRWLPKGCKVILEGNVNESVKRIVAEEGRLLVELDQDSYFRRQHQMSGRVLGSSFTPQAGRAGSSTPQATE